MDLSVCIDAVFRRQDSVRALHAVRDAGLRAVEFWSWWDKDLAAIRRASEELHLRIAAFCTRFVSLVDPSKREEYLAGLRETLAVAKQLDCPTLITQVGAERAGVPRAEQHRSLVEGLRACAPLLAAEGRVLAFEPLNTRVDHKGYYLSSSGEAFQIADEVASPHVQVLYDLYHQQIMEGDLIARCTPHIAQIAHFHAAGVPGRHELTRGEVAYPQVLRAIRAAGYAGFVGLEYFPLDEPLAGLREARRMLET